MTLIPFPTGRRALARPNSAPSHRLAHVTSASAVTRPADLGPTYLEEGFEALAREQAHLHAANGEALSRRRTAVAAALDLHVDRATQLIDLDAPLVQAARDQLRDAEAALAPLLLRSSRSRLGYRLRTIGLLLGDIVGTSMAAVALGELPVLAVIQGGSAGVAAVTAGLAGEQLGRAAHTDLRAHSDELPESLARYRHLLDGRRAGSGWLAGLALLALVVVVLLGSGIYTLRTAIEGPASGWLFAALSSGIALASFINAWIHADAVADLLDTAERTYRRAIRRHQRLSLGTRLLLGLHAREVAASTGREHAARGAAASEHLAADMNRALLESPDVVGHGRPLSPIGRTLRRGGYR